MSMNTKGTVPVMSQQFSYAEQKVTGTAKTFKIWVTNKMEHQRLKSSGMLCMSTGKELPVFQMIAVHSSSGSESVTAWPWRWRHYSPSNDCSAFIFRVRVRNCLTLKMKALQSYKRLVTWHLIFIKTAAKTSNLAI